MLEMLVAMVNIFKQEITIDNLKDENQALTSKLNHFKDKFYNLIQLLMDKIFRIKEAEAKGICKKIIQL